MLSGDIGYYQERTINKLPSIMSVRKYKLTPVCQTYAKEHIIAECANTGLTKRDLTALTKYRSQRVLTLDHVHADSLAFLEGWSDLHSLRMYGCRIPDCTMLARLKNFQHLWYVTNRQKTPDLSFLSSLKHLEVLGLGYVTYLKAIPDLSRCKRLKRLSIFNCRNLLDIDAVTRIPKLQSFSIVCTPQVPGDLERIMSMKTLKTMSGAFGSKAKTDDFHRLLKDHGLTYG